MKVCSNWSVHITKIVTPINGKTSLEQNANDLGLWYEVVGISKAYTYFQMMILGGP